MSPAEEPPLDQIRETVARMERNLSLSGGRLTGELLVRYRTLMARFAADLPSEREQLLSRAAVLMLIQASDQDAADGK